MKRTCHVISILLLIGFAGSFGCGGGENGGVEEPPVIPPQKAAQMDYPMPIGDEEGGVFGFTNSGDPLKDANLNDLYYLRVMIETVDKTKSIFKSSSASGINMEALGPHNITIYGTKVVLKKWNGSELSNGLYEKINEDRDLKNLTIYADRVEIHNRIFIPGANVKIHARELIFARNNDKTDEWACIDTSGASTGLFNEMDSSNKPVRPPTWRDPATPSNESTNMITGWENWYVGGKVRNSRNGADAGNIDLNINAYNPAYVDSGYDDESKEDHSLDRFIMKGENGEHAALGRCGADGKSTDKIVNAPTPDGPVKFIDVKCSTIGYGWKDSIHYINTLQGVFGIDVISANMTDRAAWDAVENKYAGAKSYGVYRAHYAQVPVTSSDGYDLDKHSSDRPHDGEDAVAPGMPGNGGYGGSLISTVQISLNESNSKNGRAGATAVYGNNQNLFAGGKGGYPRKAYELELQWSPSPGATVSYSQSTGQAGYSSYRAIVYKVIDTVITKDGASYVSQTGSDGIPGKRELREKQYSYLHPSMLHQVIVKGKDIFLRGYRDYALNYFEQYIALIDNYQASAEWIAADMNSAEREQIVQAELEMRQIVQCISSGLDYFGNPTGWVPMVSVEVTMAVYENEINNAMQAMYLKYWLSKDFRSNVDIIQSATSMRQTVIDDIASLKIEYKKQVAALKELESKAVEVDGKCAALEAEIEKQRQYYINKAKDSLKADKFSKVCGVASTMLKACPVGQPYTTIGAAGLDLISKEPNSLGDMAKALAPYSSAGMDLCKTWAPAFSLGAHYASFDNTLSGKIELFNTGYEAMASTNYYDPNPNNLSLYQIAKPMVKAGGAEIPKAFKDSAIPQGAVEKIANQLMAESWDFQELNRAMKALLKEKGEIAAKLLETNEKLTAAISGIAVKTQTVKQLSGYIVNNTSIGFAQAAVYVDEMDQQARERLLKYHYYMAKAYEYRMLKRYEGNLTVQNVFDTILRQYEQTNNNGVIGTNRLLTAEQFASLKSIYQNEISKVVQEMYTYKVNNPPAYGMPVSFRLSTQQVEELNEQGRLRINPVRMNIFYDTEENIRINDVKIYFKTDVDGAFPGNSGYVELKTTHGGVSVIDYKGNRYLFKHYNNMTESLKSWATRKDLVRGTEYFSKPSASETTLFGTLMKNNDSDMAYYSLPSARADMDVIKKVQTSNGQKVNITEVIVEISYEYSELDNCSMVKVLAANNSLAPTIAVDREDTCKQTSGFGYFTRTYPHGDGSVLFTAPATYGEWTFSKWVNGGGDTISTSPQVQVDLGDVAIIRPIYTNPEVTE